MCKRRVKKQGALPQHLNASLNEPRDTLTLEPWGRMCLRLGFDIYLLNVNLLSYRDSSRGGQDGRFVPLRKFLLPSPFCSTTARIKSVRFVFIKERDSFASSGWLITVFVYKSIQSWKISHQKCTEVCFYRSVLLFYERNT